jgi:biotin carboxyl carrier protein
VRLEIEVAGRLRSISIEPAAAGRFRVTVDGRSREVEVRRAGDHGLVLFSPDPDKSKSRAGLAAAAPHELFVAPAGAPGQALVTFAGRTTLVTVNGRRAARAGEPGAHAHGEQRVVAPMPGRVVRVLVSAGEDVKARQGLVVVEAMKMENELRAPKAGRVKEVGVAAGASVEAGRVLVVIE